jgi:putative CocE/NonD family hydrolase
MFSHGPYSLEIERNIPARMRDDTILYADIYHPKGTGPFPVLLYRTPYNKGRNVTVDLAERAASFGYLVVIQDVRGRFTSEGKFRPALYSADTDDAADGYDTVEWASALPDSSGKVGTFGISYNAWTQWELAHTQPPHLVAMFAGGLAANLLDRELSGVLRLGRVLYSTINTFTPPMRPRQPEFLGPHQVEEAEEIWEKLDRWKWLWYLPLSEIPDDVLGGMKPYFLHWLQNHTTDFFGFTEKHKNIGVPVYSLTGWYDQQIGTIKQYLGMTENGMTTHARKNQKLIIGPWSHAYDSNRQVGEVDFGPEAEFDYVSLMVRWFDYWLKDRNNGIMDEPPIRIFVMGKNAWREEKEWPLARTIYTSYYLHSKGRANTSAGDGFLSKNPPEDEPPDAYTYDPRDPIMTLYTIRGQDEPLNHRLHNDRRDNLVYVTEPLLEPLEVTGPITLELWASSSARDTDFTARLIDVYPDGFCHPLCYGVIRARYRVSLEKPIPLEFNQVYKFTVMIQPTSNLFLPGHRIRLDISSSDFPNLDRNHNTGGNDYFEAHFVVAQQKIYHDRNHPSKVILPTIPK